MNAVFYQRDSVDQFAHFYKYDADNRLTEVSTSTQINTYYRASSQSIWRFIEATYDYYKHGPLARTELGTMRVQGMDYAYTLQGWLKGVNSAYLSPTIDMGQDGNLANASRKYVGRDAYGYILNYYKSDYKGAGTILFDPDVTAAVATQSGFYKTANELFNGNIRSMTVAIKKFVNPQAYKYRYDQLNRLVALDSTWQGATQTALPNTWTKSINYREAINYDPNGNIKTYTRNQQTGTLMDNLAYNYNANTNQLRQVTDGVAAASFTTDIDNQANTNNYTYDGIGNMIADASDGVTISWSPYGKITDVNKTVAPASKLFYGYDVSQNRVLKGVINGVDTSRTYYIRDAQGNTMAVYTRKKDTIVWTEQHLYGSSRLGTWEPKLRLTPSVDTVKKWQVREGQKRYELSNHLGNVLVTINDRRKGTDTNADTFFDVYDGVEITATDYYPFGMSMPNRDFKQANKDGYRYSFNGKEDDNEWGKQDYGARMYDERLGRWLSLDPLAKEYTSWSPYHFGFNNPITTIDRNGKENIVVIGSQHDASSGNKLMFVHQGLRQVQKYAQDEKKEQTTVLMFTEGYTEKQIKRFEREAEKYGACVVRVNSSDELTNYVNSKNTTDANVTKDRKVDPVSNIDAFAHGLVGSIEFGYELASAAKAKFDVNSASKIDKGALSKDALVCSYACRTGLGNRNINNVKYPWESPNEDQSLAQEIANKTGATVKAYMTRSDYSSTLSMRIERIDYKLSKNLGQGSKNPETQKWVKQFDEMLKNREIIDGATFDPQGARHGVEAGTTPVGVPEGQKTYKPKSK